MKSIQFSALLLLAASCSIACDGEDGEDTTGNSMAPAGVQVGTAPPQPATAPATAPADTGTGDGTGMGDGTGPTDTTPTPPPATAAKVACQSGTVTASDFDSQILAWDVQDGKTATEPEVGDDSATPVALTVPAGATNDPYVAAVLSTYAESGRECFDVSSFTGVQFDLAASLDAPTGDDAVQPVILFKVGQSAADPAGHCDEAGDVGCFANPFKIVQAGTAIQVAFTELQATTWGVMAPFKGDETVSLIWATDDRTEGSTLSVSNISFY